MKALCALLLLLLFTDACVDRLDFDVGDTGKSEIVVDGFISDQEGPYTVTIQTALNPDDNLNIKGNGVIAKRVTLYDSEGHSENLIAIEPGEYKTKADGIRGKTGNSYHLEIELADGSIFTSEPEKIMPSSPIDSISAVWVENKPIDGPTQFGFRIFIDSSQPPDGEDVHLRWRFTGTFTSRTFPSMHRFKGQNCRMEPPSPPDPLPCSGVQSVNGILRTVGNCSCCDCWVSEPGARPILNDNLFTDGSVRNLEVGFVSFNEWTFAGGKYMVKVEQMRMSLNSFNFWKIIRDQKEGLKSLFQPSFGKIPSNFSSENSDRSIVGVFSAISIKSKVRFLRSEDAPISVPAFSINPPSNNCVLWISCVSLFPNSSVSPPPEWE